MASPFVEIEIDTPTGEHVVKVTNPDRTYFPGLPEGRGRKIDLVEYYLSVGDGIVRALRERPTVLKRHPEGAESPPVYTKRVPEGRAAVGADGHGRVPQRPQRHRAVPGRRRPRRLGGADVDLRLPPLAVAPRRRRAPRRAADRPRPDARHRLGRRRRDRARGQGALRRARAGQLPEDQRQQGHPRLPAGAARVHVPAAAPRRARRGPRGRAAPPGARDQPVVEGGARRAGVPRLQPDGPRPDDRVGVLGAGPAEARR